MEGACGKILTTEDPNVVIKKVHRRNRPQQRTCSLKAPEQAKMQEWARGLCSSQGFALLYVPKAWAPDAHTYKMERITTETPLTYTEIQGHPVVSELKIFYDRAKSEGVFPADYELYIQPDGRVAMIDFDKFGSWYPDGSMQYPWGLKLLTDQVNNILHHILG